ncbi:putative cyclin-D6-1 [Camellia lanceoleosa]|uniref:Cyclin-D6-1 n=1 Tax=Camellia lanceoleosa TaxID=1840588 RepID=A0ACC0H7C6_9ERIC|nr:putative cyclin-D6-1 [Camellia lanceoleosa]
MDYDPTHPFLQRNDEAFKKFFNVESEFMAAQGYSDNAEKAITRSIVVTLIEILSKGTDYDAFVPYLAVNYLDRFLSRKSHLPALERNPRKNTKLFAICCFTLASKMRNRDFSVPNFLAKRKLTTSVNPLLFLVMELRILTTLEWRMRSLTAINFMEYFYPFFKLRHPQPIRGFTRRDISQSILSVQGDIKFTQFKPSIIAASAVLSASFEAFPAQILQRAEAFLRCQYIDKDALLLYMEAMGIEVQQNMEGLKEAVKLDEVKKLRKMKQVKSGKRKEWRKSRNLGNKGKNLQKT